MEGTWLGLNERVIFNKSLVRKLGSAKDLDNTKKKQIFMKPDLENYDKWIKKRIEFQTGHGRGEKIKNTDNFDSSDEDEYKVPLDPFHLTGAATDGKTTPKGAKHFHRDMFISTSALNTEPSSEVPTATNSKATSGQSSHNQATPITMKKIFLAKKFAATVKHEDMSEHLKKEIIVQRNREELMRNVNHFNK